MSYRSSAGWFWPDLDALPVEPAPLPAPGAATPPPLARADRPGRADRWAQPAPPPERRAGEAHPAAFPPDRAARPASEREGAAPAIRSLSPEAG
ncbi:MAG: hypothetical protein K6T74_11580 [Geminicoccaceae bacterium]|nr:hypothetical protein [Geminicoccaceae bacterium]